MTQKKTKAEIPADMWLHVATDALARYVAGGGHLELLVSTDTEDEVREIHLYLPITPDDPRLSPSFVALFPVMEPTP
jgi:hypothetical protein